MVLGWTPRLIIYFWGSYINWSNPTICFFLVLDPRVFWVGRPVTVDICYKKQKNFAGYELLGVFFLLVFCFCFLNCVLVVFFSQICVVRNLSMMDKLEIDHGRNLSMMDKFHTYHHLG